MRLFSLALLPVLSALAASTLLGSQTDTSFEDCAAPSGPSSAPRSPPRLQLTDPQSRRYASALQEGAKQSVNFAGHYILTTWGCGAGCLMAAAIDARSGHVAMFPFTVSDWPLTASEPLSYRVDSCFLQVQGRLNEQSTGVHVYRFDGQHFHLREAVRP